MSADNAPSSSEGSRGEIFELDDWLTDQIAGRFPPILEIQANLAGSLWPFSNAVIGNADIAVPVETARLRILNQATNDFLDLFHEAMSGSGRPAVRTARSLFEHLVNYRWIASRPAEAERYCDQAAIGELLDLELNTVTEDQFSGPTRRKVRHWRHKLERRIRPSAAAAVAKHGPWFRRTWTQTTLHDRAAQEGLAGEYDSYRLLSAVIHGAAGGDLGHRQEIDGSQVLRTGPAIGVCPYALKTGLRHFKMLVSDVGRVVGPGPTGQLSGALDQLEAALPVHDALCQAVDQDIWPDRAPIQMMFLRVEVDGTWTWLLLDAELPRTIEAEPVRLEPERLKRTRDIVDGVEAANPGRTKPLIVGIKGLKGNPKPGATWQPASTTLRQLAPWEEGADFKALEVVTPVWDPSLHD